MSFCLSQPPDWSLGLPGGRGGGGRSGAGDRTEGMVTLACVAVGRSWPNLVLVRNRVQGGLLWAQEHFVLREEKTVIL